jgi:hypothetical protein
MRGQSGHIGPQYPVWTDALVGVVTDKACEVLAAQRQHGQPGDQLDGVEPGRARKMAEQLTRTDERWRSMD